MPPRCMRAMPAAQRLNARCLAALCSQALAQAERGITRSRGVTAMAVSPDGSRLLAAYADSTVRRPLQRCVALVPPVLKRAAPRRPQMCMFDSARPSIGPTAQFGGHAATSFYVKVAFAPDGTHVASGSCDRRVYVWQADRPCDGPYTLEGHGGEVTGLDWAAGDFGRMASCADDGSLRVWSVRRPDVLPRRVLPRRERATQPAAHRAAAAAAAAAVPPPPLTAPRVEVLGAESAAAFDTPAAVPMPRAASWLEAAMQPAAPMPEAPQAGAPAEAAMQDAPASDAGAGAEQLPMQEEAVPAAQRSKAVQSRSITDFFQPVRPPLLQAECVNAAAGPNGTPEARIA